MVPYLYREIPSDRPAPKPLSRVPAVAGWAWVTWTLPGLTRATVAVPEHHEDAGGGDALGRALAGITTEIALQDAALVSKVPRTRHEGARALVGKGIHGNTRAS